MKRLSDKELDTRINSFLTRKFEELELDEAPERSLARGISSARDHSDSFRTPSRFSLHWHHA